jgi:16S rRNA (cytosine1402-N4)-methyltransferase
MMNYYHKSVLLEESIEALNVESGNKYIDATFGGGGHASLILKNGGFVLGIDQDQDAITAASEKYADEIKKGILTLARGNFRRIDEFAKSFGKVNGIIFDLGLSSHQIDNPSRGFSYIKSGPLDMRMDQGLGVKASDLVNALGKQELVELFRNYSEETNANKIADMIIKRRKITPFQTTDDLTLTLATVYGFRTINDFARATAGKRVFQALRIAINDEIGSIEESLPKALSLLESGGRIVVITFHSLEDRIVKKMFLMFEDKGYGRVITKKPILPTEEEIIENGRSKSAKLRIFELK